MPETVKKRRYGRLILNCAVALLVALLVYFAWDDIVEAWNLLSQVNPLILSLLIPVQILSFFAGGMMVFTYLRGRDQLKTTKMPEVAAMSLELNFMNHIFPSGGISGVTYMVWRLGKMGVNSGQAMMAQIIRFVMIGAAFATMLMISLIVVTIDNQADNWLVLVAAFAVSAMVSVVLFATYLVASEKRVVSFSHWLSRLINGLVKRVTFGKIKKVLSIEKSEKFFLEIFEDYQVLKSQKKLLVKPLLWAFAFVALDVSLFAVAFWALGTPFNPALLVIAYGAASLAGMVMITPGGAGGYEITMVGVLGAGGMETSSATSGVILARVILILGTLLSGYVVYHRAMKKFGKPDLGTKVGLSGSGK